MEPATWKLSPRRELRLALLAAMESCWVYAVFAFLGTWSKTTVSYAALFAVYWIALGVGRALPRLKWRWALVQAMAIVIALIAILVVVRVELYPTAAVFDGAWLFHYTSSLFVLDSIDAPLATLGIAYVFIRGLGFAQRPLTLWFVGFQFRLGIVVFFLTLAASGLLARFDPTGWILVYFCLSLVAIALARIDEMGSEIRLGSHWAVTLVVAVAVVVLLGISAAQIFDLRAANLLARLLAPLWLLVVFIFGVMAVPFGIVVGWLFELLEPLLAPLRGGIAEMLDNLLPSSMQENLPMRTAPPEAIEAIVSIGRVAAILIVLLSVGYVLARALHRRMTEIEEEEYMREAIGEEGAARADGAQRAKKARPFRKNVPFAAETVRRIYAALLAHARNAGVPRGDSETPYEFLPRLHSAFPSASEDVRAITDAYVAVHYGEREFDSEQVRRVREAWQRVQRALRNK